MADTSTTIPVPTIATPSIPATPTAQTVYGADNIAQAATNPAPLVNPALDEYNAFLNTPELTAAKSEVTKLQQAINQERQGLRNTTTGLEYQNDKALGTTGASMNLIGRQIGRASQLASDRIAGLGEQLNAAQAFAQGLEQTRKEQYNVYMQEKQRIQSLIAQTGNKAGIKTTDSFEVATQKAYDWQKSEAKKAEKKAQEEQKDAYKKELKSQLRALGKSTNNLSTKELEKKLEKYNKKALEEAKSRSDQEWNMKVAQFNKSMSGGESSKNSAITGLLTKAANMSSGGAEWAKKNASLYGLTESDITPYLKGNWGDGYRETQQASIPKKIGVDENGNDIFVDANGNRVEWVDN